MRDVHLHVVRRHLVADSIVGREIWGWGPSAVVHVQYNDLNDVTWRAQRV